MSGINRKVSSSYVCFCSKAVKDDKTPSYYALIAKKNVTCLKMKGIYVYDVGEDTIYCNQLLPPSPEYEQVRFGISNNPGQFVFPGGGASDVDQTLDELAEETGVVMTKSWTNAPLTKYHFRFIQVDRKYNMLYILVDDVNELRELSTFINGNIAEGSVHDQELESVQVVELKAIPKVVPVAKMDPGFCGRKTVEFWRRDFERLLRSMDCLTLYKVVPGSDVLGIHEFQEDWRPHLTSVLEKFLNDRNAARRHPRGYKSYCGEMELVDSTQVPNKYLTEWFAEAATRIPSIFESEPKVL